MFLYCDYLIVNISKTRDDDIFNYSLTHIYVCIRACDILLCRCFLIIFFWLERVFNIGSCQTYEVTYAI